MMVEPSIVIIFSYIFAYLMGPRDRYRFMLFFVVNWTIPS